MAAAGGTCSEDLAVDAVAVSWVDDLSLVGVDGSSHIDVGVEELVYIDNAWVVIRATDMYLTCV